MWGSRAPGGASLWRAQWSEHGAPFADVARVQPSRTMTHGLGLQRAAAQTYDATARCVAEPTSSAASFAAKTRSDIRFGTRVFHEKFGYDAVIAQDGNKLEVDVERAGRKRVIDSFVKQAS